MAAVGHKRARLHYAASAEGSAADSALEHAAGWVVWARRGDVPTSPWTRVTLPGVADMEHVCDLRRALCAQLCPDVSTSLVQARLVRLGAGAAAGAGAGSVADTAGDAGGVCGTADGASPTAEEEDGSVALNPVQLLAHSAVTDGSYVLLGVMHPTSFHGLQQVRPGVYGHLGSYNSTCTRIFRALLTPEGQVQSLVRIAHDGTERHVRFIHVPSPTGGCLPHTSSDTVLVRACYDAFYRDALRSMTRQADGKPAYCAIVGTSDSSMSTFAWFVIARVVREQPTRTIVYQSAQTQVAWLFRPDQPVASLRFSDVTALSDLSSPNTLWIADGVAPFCPPCDVLYIPFSGVPTAEARCFMKEALAYTMPPYTEEELWDLHHVAFADVPAAGVRLRLAVWGPHPRVCLSYTEEHIRGMWSGGWQSIRDSSPASILAAITSHGGMDQVTDQLVVRVIRDQEPATGALCYIGSDRDFSTPLLADWAMAQCGFDTVWDARERLRSFRMESLTPMAEGFRWPQIAMKVVLQGGRFDSWLLTADRKHVMEVGGGWEGGGGGLNLLVLAHKAVAGCCRARTWRNNQSRCAMPCSGGLSLATPRCQCTLPPHGVGIIPPLRPAADSAVLQLKLPTPVHHCCHSRTAQRLRRSRHPPATHLPSFVSALRHVAPHTVPSGQHSAAAHCRVCMRP
jgi:hypothetical protein